jgi:hypothetical protein
MKTTASFWQLIARDSSRLIGMTKAASEAFEKDFLGELQPILVKLNQAANERAQAEALRGNVSVKDGVVIVDEDDVTDGPGESTIVSSKRSVREIPIGSFQDRERKIRYMGRVFNARNMGCGIVQMFNFLKKKGIGTFKHAEFAKAVADAYPENTYGEHRVAYDFDKWINQRFTCQRRDCGRR